MTASEFLSATSQDTPSALEPTEVRLALFERGYVPLPLNGKIPEGKGWQKREQTNEREIELWSRVYPYSANTGVLCRLTPVLDCDILDVEAAEAVKDFIYERYDAYRVLTRTGKPPKFATPFRTTKPFPKISVTLIAPDGSEQGIEFLCDGQQCAVHGVHPDTREPYSWNGAALWDVDHDDLSGIDAEGAQQLVDQIVELVVGEFGYQRKLAARGKDPDVGNGAAGGWPGFGDLISHDDLTPYAMKLLVAGMADGAAVNMLRAQVSSLPGVDEDRRARRLAEIPDMVRSARRKLDEEARGAQKVASSPFPEINEAAYHGLAGDIVRAIQPHTEADPVAILIQTLTFFGNVIGSNPHYLVEADRHRGNLFAVLVGATAKGRKGTSAGRVRAIFKDADDVWRSHRIAIQEKARQRRDCQPRVAFGKSHAAKTS